MLPELLRLKARDGSSGEVFCHGLVRVLGLPQGASGEAACSEAPESAQAARVKGTADRQACRPPEGWMPPHFSETG